MYIFNYKLVLYIKKSEFRISIATLKFINFFIGNVVRIIWEYYNLILL